MKFGSIVLLPFLAPLASAQLHTLWSASYDSPQAQADWGYKLVFTASNEVCVTGRSLNQTSGSPPPPPTEDTITLKYDANGALLWAQRWDGLGGSDNGRDVAVDSSDGSVYSAGYTSGYVAGSYVTDTALLKYDAAGTLSWSRTWDGPGASADFARAVRLASNGEILVAGYSYNASANPDGLLLRYDPAGNLLSATLVDGSAHAQDYFATLALAPNGEAVAVGQANSNGSSSSMLVARFSASGALLWQREYDGAGSGLEYALGVAVDASGTAYVSGYTSTLASGQDATLLAYDAAGNLLFARTLDGAAHANDQAPEVALDAQGHAYLGGYLNQGATKLDFLVAKYDPSGTQLWQRTWDAPAHLDDQGQFLVVDALGNATLAGNVYGSSGQASDRDIAVVRWDPQGNLRGARLFSSPGADDDRPYDLAQAPDGTLGVTGSTHGATQYLQDVWTIVLADQSRAFCFGDGQLASCPCANSSPIAAQAGCANSAGLAARLADSGDASLAADTLVLMSSGELPSALTIFLQGTTQVAPLSFGDGLRCTGGALKRLYVKNAVGGVASAPAPGNPSVSQQSAALGDPLAAGARRYLQAYYRDANAAFCPAPQGSTFNVSSGLVLDWAP